MKRLHLKDATRFIFRAFVCSLLLSGILYAASIATTMAQGPTPSQPVVSRKPATPVVYDDFNDNKIDFTKWVSYSVGAGPTFAETNNQLEITIPASSNGTIFVGGLTSTCGLSGDFDIEVGFQLLNWPSKTGVRVGLSPGWAVERASLSDKEYPPTALREVYVMDGMNSSYTATSDQSGKLRLVRSGNTMTGYYFSGSWVPVASSAAKTTGTTNFFIAAWSHNWAFTNQDAKIAFDDVIVNQGTLVCADFTVTGVEVTQGIQNLNNSVPLVKDKETLVRVFVQARSYQGGLTSDVANVTAQLSGGVGGSLKPKPESITVVSSPVTNRPTDTERTTLSRSLNFYLPKGWLSATGTINLTVQVNPDCTTPEWNCNNNQLTVPVTFVEEPPLVLYMYNLVWKTSDGLVMRTSPRYRDRIVAKIAAMYPVPSVTVKFKEIVVSPWTDDPGFYSHVDLVGDIASVFSEENAPKDAVALGYMEGAKDGYTALWGNVASFGMRETNYGVWTAAHELGHIFGLKHIPAPSSCTSAFRINPYSAYPYPEGRLSSSLESYLGTTFYAYDPTYKSTGTQEIISPRDWDIMNYCARQWMSDYSWNLVRAKHPMSIPSQTAQLNPGPGEYLYASGAISLTTNTVTLSPFYRLASATGKSLPASGDYSLQLLAGASLLASYPFTVTEPIDGRADAEPFNTFGMWVPYITGTTHIEIRRNSQLLASRQVSNNAPTVSFVSPSAGMRVAQTTSVMWNASDIDGDSLTYWVQYSKDNGVSWQTVAIGLKTNAFDLDTTHIPGSAQARLKVIATDGVNTTEAISSQFQVPRNAPEATILTPDDQSSYSPGDLVRLQGTAWDEEDGDLVDATLIWTDNLNGALGTGKVLNVSSLTPGWHTITLTARDSDNMAGTATVTIYVSGSFLYLPLITR